jgi:AMP-polyphosphate phosphotransferase
VDDDRFALAQAAPSFKAAHDISKKQLRADALNTQFELRDSPYSVVVLVSGMDGAGRSDSVDRLLHWLDARRITVHADPRGTEEERERSFFYRFWRRLPPTGEMAVFFGSWYAEPIRRRALGEMSDEKFRRRLARIEAFEDLLVRERVIVIKFWLHLTREQQYERLHAAASDPARAWQVSQDDWRMWSKHTELSNTALEAIEATEHAGHPWQVVAAADDKHRDRSLVHLLTSTLRERLAGPAPETPSAPEVLPAPPPDHVQAGLDFSKSLAKKEYKARRDRLQSRLGRLVRALRDTERSMVLVFEGQDAAGKGGAIRRITEALDARYFDVIPIGAPNEAERARPYLWRFWTHLPMHGELTIFDRSWYGRVLVERIEGFCTEEAWRRAYDEINEFEAQLSDSGVIVAKFWIAIDSNEQLARFEDREETEYKQYKLTDEDWRNREKWGAYEAAVHDMVTRTSSADAPWTLVEGNCKRFARIKVLETVCSRLEQVLGPSPDPDETEPF